MSKELWFRCYEQVYNEHSEDTSEEVLVQLTEEKVREKEADLCDLARDLYKEGLR